MKTYLDNLDDSWLQENNVIVYGLGRTGEQMIAYLMDVLKLQISCIIDNDPKKQKMGKFLGVDIISLKQAKSVIKNKKIVVMAGAMAYSAIADTLKDSGYREFIDFCSVEQYILEYCWKKEKKVVLCKISTMITTACSLKCKHCSVFIPEHNEKVIFSCEQMKADMDAFFRLVDDVICYQFVGGEPFLNKELKEIIEYLVSQYGERVNNIQIITNGTCIPDEPTLKAMQENKVSVRISDYTTQVEYKEKLDKLLSKLDEKGIEHSSLVQMEWSDLGFPYEKTDWGDDPELIHQHMMCCSHNCQLLNDRKYYFCSSVWSAEKCGLMKTQKDDFIQLEELNPLDESHKKSILEYTLGNLPGKGYLSLCRFCNGYGSDNKIIIPAGEQK